MNPIHLTLTPEQVQDITTAINREIEYFDIEYEDTCDMKEADKAYYYRLIATLGFINTVTAINNSEQPA